jgi:hypothetical protein
MSDDIDWAKVLIYTPIIKYSSKTETIELSLANRSIRVKLLSVIFKQLEVTEDVLDSHSDYFNRNKYYKFDNFNCREKFKLARKYGLNKELAFKEVYINPFIEVINNTMKSSNASIYCKSLTFHLLHNSIYFIFPIFNNFLNLNELTLRWCDISYIEFSNLLNKLGSLEVLAMHSINLILSKSENPNLGRNLLFPKSLKELTYHTVSLITTDHPQLKPLNFVRSWKSKLDLPNLGLKPQLLPNLKHLNYFDRNWGTGLTKEFIDLNPKVNYRDESKNLCLLID